MPSPEAYINFGRKVRRIRKALHMTVAVLAGRAGMTKRHIKEIELGERAPSLEMVIGLVRGLGVAPDVFFGMQNKQRLHEQEVPSNELRPQTDELWTASTPPELQDMVQAILRVIARSRMRS